MCLKGIAALYLDASTSLSYYTGLRAEGKERLHGAVIPADGPLSYICLAFEVQKTTASILIWGEIRGWDKHKDPKTLVIDTVEAQGVSGALAVDKPTAFCFVLLGESTAYPHGQTLNEGDMVLIDTVITVEGYHSEISHSYVFGEPTPRQREIRKLELAA